VLYPPRFPFKRMAFLTAALILGACLLSIEALLDVSTPRADAHAAREPQRPPRDPSNAPGKLIRDLAAALPRAVADSTAVLMTRSKGSYRYLRHMPEGRTQHVPVDPAGGPFARLMANKRESPKSVLAFYAWQQGPFRDLVRDLRARNTAAWDRLRPVQDTAARLVRVLADGHRPESIPAATAPRSGCWPERCLAGLLEAGLRDPAAAHGWAVELHAALAGLADLHRWVDLLTACDLAMVDLQARCLEAYVYANPLAPPNFMECLDYLPAAWLDGARLSNYLIVETLAGLWLSPADAQPGALARPAGREDAAHCLPHPLRKHYRDIRSRLGERGRHLWDRAAAAPFERSYLANILRRARDGGVVDPLAVVLRRFERTNPAGTVADMMDVLFHRAGSISSCIQAGDRYDPRLMAATENLSGTNDHVLRQAHHAAHAVLGDWRNYQGRVWTIKEALDTRKLDCVRGTDIVGALYRNAGRGGCYLVRVACGSAGHSMFAVRSGRGAERRILLADSLVDEPPHLEWPEAFYDGLVWPEGYPAHRAPAYSAELGARGLDNYVFIEGYVIRGPHAGEIVRTPVPYLQGHTASGMELICADARAREPASAE